MVQEVTLQLSRLNSILFGDPLTDVTFRVPELEDISQAVVENTLDRTDLDESLQAFVDDVIDEVQAAAIDVDAIADQLVDDVEDRVSEIVVSVDDLADAVVDRLDLEDLVTDQVNISGVFGPLTDDIVRAFEEVLEDIREDLDSLQGLPEEIETIVEEALAGIDTSIDLPDILDDPVGYLVDAAGQLLDERTSEETRETAAAFREEFGP